jgi:bacterioferritin-associated ferredoxin
MYICICESVNENQLCDIFKSCKTLKEVKRQGVGNQCKKCLVEVSERLKKYQGENEWQQKTT